MLSAGYDAVPAPASPAASAVQVAECLRDAGFEPTAAVRATPIRRGPLADTLLVEGLAGIGAAVLKIHRLDLGEAIRADPDRRFETIARALAVPPWFCATRLRMERARRAIPVAVPAVLAEGRRDGGSIYTLMSRLPGRPWRPDDRLASSRLAAEAGAILVALHRGSGGAPSGGSDLASAPGGHRDLAGVIADHVPDLVAGGAEGRISLRERLEALVARALAAPLGASVLAHGDFHPSNLLVGDDGRISGIVDFGLSCPGPRALDFRALGAFHDPAFLEGYGMPREDRALAYWQGDFYELLWQGVAMVTTSRFGGVDPGPEYWIAYSAAFEYTLLVLEDEGLRRGPPERRRLLRAALERRARRLVAARAPQPGGRRAS